MKNTKTITISGYSIYLLIIFAVLFDPTEMAVGSEFVTLPGIALVIAQGLGNITWIIGLVYAFVTVFCVWALVDDEVFLDGLKKAIETGSIKSYTPKWYQTPISILGIVFSLIALASGFWFTGFFWFIAIIAAKLMTAQVRKTKEYLEWKEAK